MDTFTKQDAQHDREDEQSTGRWMSAWFTRNEDKKKKKKVKRPVKRRRTGVKPY